MSDQPHVDRHFSIIAILDRVHTDLLHAVLKHGPMHSYHEGASVLREEFEELWDEVKQQHPDNAKLVEEASHVAAMACRFILDLCEAA